MSNQEPEKARAKQVYRPELTDVLCGEKKDMPNPTEEDLDDPIFEAIWQATKTWDVNVPEYYSGYCGITG